VGRGAARPPGTRAVTAVAGATEARPSAEGPAGGGGVMNTLRLGELRVAASQHREKSRIAAWRVALHRKPSGGNTGKCACD
jgi:hypothetical protein